MRILLGFPLSFILAAGISACSADECADNKNSPPLAGFYTMDDGRLQEVSIDSISVFGVGAPGDSLILDTASSVSEEYLPFDICSESSTFVLSYDAPSLRENGKSPYDVITFNYRKRPEFVSHACGAVYVYEITDIVSTHHFIETVDCPDGEIGNADIQNIRIFFKNNIREEDGDR